jgi:Icc-related predicted phosphoesterase
MRIIFISDTHTLHHELDESLDNLYIENPDSILVHCGDVSSRGRNYEIENFLVWYDALPFKNKILIAGNHDFYFENSPDGASMLIEEFGKSIIYLEDSGIEIDGVKFWGSPVTPWFYDWAFNRRDDIKDHWDLIPSDTNVLITHGPPFGILDITARERIHVGCQLLRNKIETLKDLKISSFGHIHEAFGTDIINDVTYVNASFLTLRYEPLNHPIVIDL